MEIATLSYIVRPLPAPPAPAFPVPASPSEPAAQSAVRFKVIGMQVMSQLLGGEIDYAKIAATGEEASASDIKASVAALSFILSSAARHDVEESTLTNELQQLGLPKEHSDSLCRPYQEQKERLREQAASTSLRLAKVEKLDWRVDYVVSSSKMADVEAPVRSPRSETNPVVPIATIHACGAVCVLGAVGVPQHGDEQRRDAHLRRLGGQVRRAAQRAQGRQRAHGHCGVDAAAANTPTPYTAPLQSD